MSQDPFWLRAKSHEYIDAKRLVLPLFYGVNPSDVRHQTGSFANAFAKYEEKYKDKLRKVKRWRSALTELANLAGWDSKDWREAELIQDIVQKIWRKLHPYTSPPAINNLSSIPSSSSSLCRPMYDVFLNFRGKDTRLNFLDHLNAALIQKGISTFRDDKDLDKGISISTQLVQAIERSTVSVVIVSPDYASSEWCLDELVKILEFRKISEEGKKYGTLMKGLRQNEEKGVHHLEGRCKMNMWKGSLQNKEDIANHNNRKPVKLRLTVNNNDGEWAGSVYTGGNYTKEIMISDDITSDELLDQIYRFIGINPNKNESSSHHNPLKNACDRRMTEVRVLVNYEGEWVNSTYVGGKTKGVVISEDITYQGLVDRMYGVIGVDSHEYKLILKTRYESKFPTKPVEIINDDDLAFFIKENLSCNISSRVTLCTTLEQRTFPYGRMDSSENSITTQTKRIETYPCYFHGVTPDLQVPYLQPNSQQQQPSYQQTSTWQTDYEHYNPCYQQLQWGYRQLHPSYIQPHSSYQQPHQMFWHHYQPYMYPPTSYQ